MLMDLAKLSTCDDYQKHVGILIVEIYIREELIYSKHKGCLEGFANLGNINKRLLKYEKALNDCTNESSLAKTMIVFMVRGLFTSLQFPYVLSHVPMSLVICYINRCGTVFFALKNVVSKFYLLLLMGLSLIEVCFGCTTHPSPLFIR